MNKVGKIIIAGLSYYDETATFLEQKQFHGKIKEVHPERGIRFIDEKGEEHVLPPRPDALFPALPGTYREHATDKIIENPDFISLWHIQKAEGDNDDWSWKPYKADLRIE